MVRSFTLAASLSLLSACAASRPAPPRPAPPAEVVFARGVLRTVSPSGWVYAKDVPVRDPSGATMVFPLMLREPRTGSTVGVMLYPTGSASPVMMADRLNAGMKDSGAEVGDVDFSLEDDSRASFRFKAADGANVAFGKSVVGRLDENVSFVAVATWSAAASADEAAVDAIVAGLAVVRRP